MPHPPGWCSLGSSAAGAAGFVRPTGCPDWPVAGPRRASPALQSPFAPQPVGSRAGTGKKSDNHNHRSSAFFLKISARFHRSMFLTSYFHWFAYSAKDETGRPEHRKVQCGSSTILSRCRKASWERSVSAAVSPRNNGSLKRWASDRNFLMVCYRNHKTNSQSVVKLKWW